MEDLTVCSTGAAETDFSWFSPVPHEEMQVKALIYRGFAGSGGVSLDDL
jgi:hypothetical protein